MPKKKDSKKPAKKVAPAAKAKVKPIAKPVAAKGKAPAPVKGVKNAPAPTKAAKAAPVAKGKAAKTVPVVAAKNAKGVTAAPAAKGAKAPKAPKVDHAVQKGLLNKHRDDHHQSDALVVAPRAKLQFYTILDLKAYLEKRNKSKIKLNVWVPDEERKAREKAAAAARSQGTRSNNIATASIADLLGGPDPLLVALDEVQDPQNLGAICRTAECAGADGLVICERRAAHAVLFLRHPGADRRRLFHAGLPRPGPGAHSHPGRAEIHQSRPDGLSTVPPHRGRPVGSAVRGG